MKIEFSSAYKNVIVLLDQAKFIQVIDNLVSNAIKFTPDGGHIYLKVYKQQTGWVVVSVQDTGIGIPEKYHAQLFEKFNGARRAGLKGQPSGGLGMSIIKTIINWHDGMITFSSEPGLGTTFFIHLKSYDAQ